MRFVALSVCVLGAFLLIACGLTPQAAVTEEGRIIALSLGAAGSILGAVWFWIEKRAHRRRLAKLPFFLEYRPMFFGLFGPKRHRARYYNPSLDF